MIEGSSSVDSVYKFSTFTLPRDATYSARLDCSDPDDAYPYGARLTLS